VRAAAIEIAPHRNNTVSSTVSIESLADDGTHFRYMPSIDLANVA